MADQYNALDRMLHAHAVDPAARAGCHLMLHPDDRDQLRRAGGRDPGTAFPGGGAMAGLTGIPVVVDRGEPRGRWRLVRTATGETVDSCCVSLSPAPGPLPSQVRVAWPDLCPARDDRPAIMAGIAAELAARRDRQRLELLAGPAYADGTGTDWRLFGRRADDYLDVVRNALFWARDPQQAGNRCSDEPTWMLAAAVRALEAFTEPDPQQLRSCLLELAATVTEWIADIDRRASEGKT